MPISDNRRNLLEITLITTPELQIAGKECYRGSFSTVPIYLPDTVTDARAPRLWAQACFEAGIAVGIANVDAKALGTQQKFIEDCSNAAARFLGTST